MNKYSDEIYKKRINIEDILVSVVVITYNSSRTVMETLDSVYKQTYQNIELIVSDDASNDNTISIVEKWIHHFRNRFINARIITTNKNTGPAQNCNRGGFHANGEWIKYIAGDDILLQNCIEDNVRFAQRSPNINLIFSKLEAFGAGNQARIEKFNRISWTKPNKLSKKDLHIIECYSNVFGTPSSFIRKDFFIELGGFDINIPFIEDWPFWVKATQKGCITIMDKTTVKYRIHPNSISMFENGNSKRFQDNLRWSKWHHIKYMRKISIMYGILGYLDYQLEYHYHLIWKLLGLTRYLNPYFYIRESIKRKIFPLDND